MRSYGPTAFVRNPETEKIVRRKRPKSEWITHQNEGLRIVSDELFAKAQARTRDRADPSKKLKAGGKVKYMLSGLLKCASCGAHCIFSDARSYACSSYLNGCCSNGVRVRRDSLEQTLIGPIRDELLRPDHVRRMAAELQKRYTQRAAAVV